MYESCPFMTVARRVFHLGTSSRRATERFRVILSVSDVASCSIATSKTRFRHQLETERKLRETASESVCPSAGWLDSSHSTNDHKVESKNEVPEHMCGSIRHSRENTRGQFASWLTISLTHPGAAAKASPLVSPVVVSPAVVLVVLTVAKSVPICWSGLSRLQNVGFRFQEYSVGTRR